MVVAILCFCLLVAAIVSFIIYKEESKVGKWSDRADKKVKLDKDTRTQQDHKKAMEALKKTTDKNK